MKKIIVVCLCLLSFRPLQAQDKQDKVELTKVDLFSLGKLPVPSQISIMGISIGDPFSEVFNKLGKYPKKSEFEKPALTEEELKKLGIKPPEVKVIVYGKQECRFISRDKKVVTGIHVLPAFKDSLVGKTSEFFELMSPDRIRTFLTQLIGGPEYIYQLDFMGWVSFIYKNGIEFQRFDVNGLFLNDQIGIDERLNDPKTKKSGDYNRPVEKPKVSSSAGFRDAFWGMTKDQVRKTESSEFVKEAKLDGDMAGIEVLSYKTDALGMDAIIAYYFAGDALTRARYLIAENHSDYNLYINDYEKIKGQLSEKYGAPERDQKIWSNELFKNDRSQYGMAIASGHVTYVAEWYPIETSIQLLMRGDNFKVSMFVEYRGDKFKEYDEDFIKRSKKNIW